MDDGEKRISENCTTLVHIGHFETLSKKVQILILKTFRPTFMAMAKRNDELISRSFLVQYFASMETFCLDFDDLGTHNELECVKLLSRLGTFFPQQKELVK